MMWYYTKNSERHGPISQPGMQSLYEQSVVTADTLVWQEGMEQWQPLHGTRLAADLCISLPDGDAWEKCAFSGDRCRRSLMVQLAGFWISPDHKDEAVQLLQQGGSLPGVALDNPFQGNIELSHLLRSSWELLVPCLPVVIALYGLIWIPGNLFIGYIESYHLREDQVLRSIQLGGWVQNLWGNIATGGILFALCQQIMGRTATFGSALGAGFTNYGRLFVATFLSGLMTVLGLVLLIIPGIIVMIRTSFVNAAAVDGQFSGSSAVQASWDTTKGYMGVTFGYMLVMGILCSVPLVLFSALSSLVPILEHWAINALCITVLELPMAYLLAFTLVFYRELKARPSRS